MPGLNGKGPQNEGSMTGRGLGNCRPTNSDENLNDQLRKVDPNNLKPTTNPADDQVVTVAVRAASPGAAAVKA